MVVLGGLLWSALAGSTVSAQRPRVFGGSLVLEDQKAPTVIDVATGQATVRLDGVYDQVGATNPRDVLAVPVQTGTMLINARTGTFNLLGNDNYVVDSAGGGVGLGTLNGLTGLRAWARARTPTSSGTRRTAPSRWWTKPPSTPAPGWSGPWPSPGTGRRRPRRRGGFASLGSAVLDEPGAAAVSGPNLWVLVGAGSGCRVVQLIPISTGNGLASTTRATLPAPCSRVALESLGPQVGAAWPGHVRLFNPSGLRRGTDIEVASTLSADRYLPVSSANGDFWFLSHAVGGWSVFGVAPNGAVTHQTALVRFGVRADPVAPVESGGVLYTLDQAAPVSPPCGRSRPSTERWSRSTGPRLTRWRALPSGRSSPGPRSWWTAPGWCSTTRGACSRWWCSPTAPMRRWLSTRAEPGGQRHGSGGGERRADHTEGPPGPAGEFAQPEKARPVVQPVNQSITCRRHHPEAVRPADHLHRAVVGLGLDRVVLPVAGPPGLRAQLLGGPRHGPRRRSSAGPPVQVVNGQTQIQFIGLRPSTTYQAVVTAYINLQSTPSAPVTFTTAARGPDEPAAVRTVADGKGDWVVSWTSCTSADCVVPAAEWNVVGTACGGSFVGQPPNLQVTGTQRSITINANALGLLGDSVSFSVQGSLASGLAGNPRSDQACTEAWRPPTSAAITLGADGAVSGQTVTATLQVSTQGGQSVQAFGSKGTQFVYRIGPATVGPTTKARLTVPGLQAGRAYATSVQIYPTGHPRALVTVSATMRASNSAGPHWRQRSGRCPTPHPGTPRPSRRLPRPSARPTRRHLDNPLRQHQRAEQVANTRSQRSLHGQRLRP